MSQHHHTTMSNDHRATPEQWGDAGAFASGTRACLLELRDRIAALEGHRETEREIGRAHV